MTKWTINGPPQPSMSLLVIPLFLAVHVLLVVFVSLVISFILQNDSLPVIVWIIFIITAFLFRGIYLRLGFNFFVWILRQNGVNTFDRVLLRSLKYSFLMFFYIPLILFIVQAFVDSKLHSKFVWATLPFKHFYVSLVLVLLVALLVEKLLPSRINEKINKIYCQRGGLMARVDW